MAVHLFEAVVDDLCQWLRSCCVNEIEPDGSLQDSTPFAQHNLAIDTRHRHYPVTDDTGASAFNRPLIKKNTPLVVSVKVGRHTAKELISHAAHVEMAMHPFQAVVHNLCQW